MRRVYWQSPSVTSTTGLTRRSQIWISLSKYACIVQLQKRFGYFDAQEITAGAVQALNNDPDLARLEWRNFLKLVLTGAGGGIRIQEEWCH